MRPYAKLGGRRMAMSSGSMDHSSAPSDRRCAIGTRHYGRSGHLAWFMAPGTKMADRRHITIEDGYIPPAGR